MRAITALILLLASIAANAELRVHAYAEPAGDVYLGQRVRLIVDVGTDTWFTSAPRYPELKLVGAIALLPEGFGVNFTEREGGKTWAVQRQRYVLFPQRVGEFEIPSLEISLAVSSDGKPGDVQVVRTPPVTINVVAPPGTADVPTFVTTPRLIVSEEWDRDFDGLKVGDAITRTITQKADDVFALVLPAIEFPDVDGFGTYPATPALDDRADRGRYSATRIDSVTYVMQAEGEFTLPAIELYWFDPVRRRMVKETFDAVEMAVAPNPDAVLGAGESEADKAGDDADATLRELLDWLAANLHWLTILAAALFLLRSLWLRLVPGWMQRLAQARKLRENSEARYFAELRRAIRSGDNDRIVASFWRWADRLPGREPPLSIAALEALDPELQAHLCALSSTRYAGGGARSTAGRGITVSRVSRLRRRWLASRRSGITSVRSGPRPGRLNP
jgi:hypothetical protein